MVHRLKKQKKWWVLLALVVSLSAFTAWSYDCYHDTLPLNAVRNAAYVGRSRCVACHQPEHQSWLGSHHDKAMQLATEETVLADFNNTKFERLGVTTRFFRQGKKFIVHAEGPDGQLQDFEIKYTFGFTPLQQYMVEFPDGRIQVLRVAWDVKKEMWFYVPPPDVLNERILASSPMHWTGLSQNWNTTCAECHSTNLQKGFDLKTNSYKTTWSEIDVSCETCHGPASVHLELANKISPFWDKNLGYGLPNLKSKNSNLEIETCASCHSRRSSIHPGFRPGDQFLDHYEPSLLHRGLYFEDGQINDEVYVYGSFIQSKMYHEGVRCSDCHNPHSLELKFKGNQLCSQCHEPAKYDTPIHHKHKKDSTGSLCVECHMPERDYMVIDGRRDHSLRIPRPDLTVQFGTPNACNQCHTKPEESAAWAAEAVLRWYGKDYKKASTWTAGFVAGNAQTENASELLQAIVRKKKSPAIVASTALVLLAQNFQAADLSKAEEKIFTAALKNKDPLVRLAAVQTYPITQKNHQVLFRLLAKKMEDHIRAVRMAAANRLVGMDQFLDAKKIARRKKVLEEFLVGSNDLLERAGTHLNLARMYEGLGKPEKASEAIRAAIRLEPYLTGARSNLALLLDGKPEYAEEVKTLRLGEIALLERDAKMLPENAVNFFRLGSLHYMLDQHQEAIKSLEEACRLDPKAANYHMMALLLWYQKIGDPKKAMQHLIKLEELTPQNPNLLPLRRQLEAMLEQMKPNEAETDKGVRKNVP